MPYYIFKRLKKKKEYRLHIWSGAAQSSFPSLDRFQNRLRGLVGDSIISTLEILTHGPDVASLSRSCRQFDKKYSNELNYFGHLQLEHCIQLPRGWITVTFPVFQIKERSSTLSSKNSHFCITDSRVSAFQNTSILPLQVKALLLFILLNYTGSPCYQLLFYSYKTLHFNISTVLTWLDIKPSTCKLKM